MNSLSWLVGLRYLSARKGSRFVSLFSFASILGMAVSVLAMIVVLSVMNGFEGELRGRILNVMPHGQISKMGGIENWQQLATDVLKLPSVMAVSPQNRTQVLLTTDGHVQGAELFGVDTQSEAGVSSISQSMIEGDWQALRAGSYNAVLGQDLARRLHVNVGDEINVTLPRVSVTPLGIFPRARFFTVVGTFAVGAQIDGSQLYVSIDDAGRLLRTAGKVDALRLRFADVLQAPEAVAALRRLPALKDYELRSWRDENRTLFNAIRMEKIMVSLMLLVVIAVAVFNLVSILTMAVADRRNDIAVLRTMGAPRSTILAIFLIYGMAMGLIGVGFGAVSGSLLALFLPDVSAWLGQIGINLVDSNTFFVPTLPSIWQWQQALLVAAMALALCLLAVFYPAWRASTIHPAEALRYE